MDSNALDLMHNPNLKGNVPTNINVAEVVVEEGLPPTAPRGGSSGRSKYEPLFASVRSAVEAGKLKPGAGFLRIPTAPETGAKDLAHLRTALKRQGKFSPDVVKVTAYPNQRAATEIHLFIPKEASLADINDVKE